MVSVTAIFVDEMQEMSSDAASMIALGVIVGGQKKQVNVVLPCDADGIAAALRVLASEIEQCRQ